MLSLLCRLPFLFLVALQPWPARSASFDCEKGKSEIEKAICGSVVLNRADSELGILYQYLEKNLPLDKKLTLKKAQLIWITKRNSQCTSANVQTSRCLKNEIQLRIDQLHTQVASIKDDSKQTVEYMVPENMEELNKAIREKFDGGPDRRMGLKFIPRLAVVPPGADRKKVAAESAANFMLKDSPAPYSGLDYFEIQGDTAYIELHIANDGWAGFSFTIDTVEPAVEKTLLNFKEIKSVQWYNPQKRKRARHNGPPAKPSLPQGEIVGLVAGPSGSIRLS